MFHFSQNVLFFLRMFHCFLKRVPKNFKHSQNFWVNPEFFPSNSQKLKNPGPTQEIPPKPQNNNVFKIVGPQRKTCLYYIYYYIFIFKIVFIFIIITIFNIIVLITIMYN